MADYASEMAELSSDATLNVRQGVGINVKRLIRLRYRTILLTFAAVFLPAAALIWMFVPQYYVAEATIQFRATDQQNFLMDPARGSAGSTVYVSYVNTQLELIDGFTILSRVLEREEIQRIPSIRSHADGALSYMMVRLEIENLDLTEVVTLYYSDPDYDDAKTILAAILEEYEAYSNDLEANIRAQRRSGLENQAASLEKKRDEKRAEIAERRAALELPAGAAPGVEPTETESYRINLANAEADITRAQSALRQTENLIERTQDFISKNNQNPSAPVYALGIEEAVNRDPNVTSLTERLAAVQQEFSALEETYVDDAPQLTVKRSELSGLEAQIAEVKGRARATALRSQLGQYEYDITVHESDLEDAQQRRERFVGLIEEYRESTGQMQDDFAKIGLLESELEDIIEYLKSVRTRIQDLDLEAEAPARASVGNVTAEGTPESSDRLKFLVLALFGALGAGGLTGLAQEAADQNIRSGEDVGYVTKLPVIASVPHSSEDRLPDNVRLASVSEDFPAAYTSEEYRRIVSRILHGGRGGGESRVCLVASAARGDGKSTVSGNLAIVLAQSGRRVLLVDIDSRNPSIEKNFGLIPSPGLAEMLSGEGLEHDPDRATDFDNLFVMGPGMHSQDLLELLASRALVDFLDGAQEIFDHIIIDTPASLLMSETRILAPHADCIVLIAGAGISTFGMVRRAISAIQDVGGHIIGVVVNGVRQAPGGYLRRNLEQYYAQNLGHTREHSDLQPLTARKRPTGTPAIVLVDEDNEP